MTKKQDKEETIKHFGPDDTSGFYKLANIKPLGYKYESEYVLEMIDTQVHKLCRAAKDSYNYPSNRWYWFDTRKEALEFFEKSVLELELVK